MLCEETIAAISTAPGEGGIAVIRVSGSKSLEIADCIFRPMRNRRVSEFSGYSVHYGAFVDPTTGESEDDGLVTVFRSPNSYTGEDTVELSCHGGRSTSTRVLNLAIAQGARLAGPGEFTQRAFLNGKLDLAQAEAVADIIRARTDTARRLARRQLDGSLSREIEAIRQGLIGILAAIEVTIDFSEEVGELDYSDIEQRLIDSLASVSALLVTAERGRIVREGIRVALIGRPNTGKSSLLNALVRSERSIVTPIAGTTRDLVEETASVMGVPVVYTDTAGIRETTDVVEEIGIDRARRCAQQSDVTLLVLDGEAGGPWQEDFALLRQLEDNEYSRTIVLINKADTLLGDRGAHLAAELEAALIGSAGRPLLISAATCFGIRELEDAILAAVCERQSSAGFLEASDSVVVSNARHRSALESAYASLVEARGTVRAGLPGDFVAIDTRGALEALSLITGQSAPDEVIHRIFHDFCVGK